MLRSFRLGNHRSFRDEHELLLTPVYDKTERSILPVVAIYGANASGKSNLIDGLQYMADAVRDSYARWHPDGGVPRRTFRLDAASSEAPSVFVVELVVDSVRYTYGFSVDDHRVLEEWLYAYPHTRRRLVFERTADEVTLGSTAISRAKRTELLAEFTRPNALFLSLGAQLGQREVMPVYRWFAKELQFVDTDASSNGLGGAAIQFIRASEGNRRKLSDLLRAADLGLDDVYVKEPPNDDRPDDRLEDHAPAGLRLGVRSKAELVFLHRTAELSLWDESAGTRSWLALLLRVLGVLTSGGTVVVDELDSRLHPELAAQLVLLFRDERANPDGAQIIFTTHNATLLGTAFGQELLERDEIWFVEKGKDGASRLYPLSDFHPRQGENRERRYLGGSYGAVPLVSEEGLVAAVEEGSPDGAR